MYTISRYKGSDIMSNLVCENYPILLVMSRFGIALGFEDKTISEVCRDNGVDIDTFLAIVNLLIDDSRDEPIDNISLSLPSLISYLRNSHSYFLDFRLPAIRRKLIESLDCSGNSMGMLIMRYYDEYVAEVRKHMDYEEENVFPYVESLLNKTPIKRYNIDIFSRQHDNVEIKLTELKNIIIRYYPANSSNELNSVLFDIFTCAKDLASHTDIEDNLFTPHVRKLELKKNR